MDVNEHNTSFKKSLPTIDFHFAVIPQTEQCWHRKIYCCVKHPWDFKAKKKYMSVYGYPSNPILSANPKPFYFHRKVKNKLN